MVAGGRLRIGLTRQERPVAQTQRHGGEASGPLDLEGRAAAILGCLGMPGKAGKMVGPLSGWVGGGMGENIFPAGLERDGTLTIYWSALARSSYY